MKRRVFFASSGLLLLSLLLVSFLSFSGPGLEQQVLTETNTFRKSKGKPALIGSGELNEIARKHSENMARGRVSFGHAGFNQRYREARKKMDGATTFAENVAYGATSAVEVVSNWKNSAGHRLNMLGKYKYIGIGTARDKKGRIYYTQVFVD